jgi:hypothetical protein
MKKSTFALITTFALACSSCDANGLYPVSGKVTYRGEPADGAVVHFRRCGADPMNEHSIMGIVQGDGTFDLVCGPLGKGAPPGEYDVLIEWRKGDGHAKGLAQRGTDKLKGLYADPARPLLRAVVKRETNSLPPFELTDKRLPRKKV